MMMKSICVCLLFVGAFSATATTTVAKATTTKMAAATTVATATTTKVAATTATTAASTATTAASTATTAASTATTAASTATTAASTATTAASTATTAASTATTAASAAATTAASGSTAASTATTTTASAAMAGTSPGCAKAMTAASTCTGTTAQQCTAGGACLTAMSSAASACTNSTPADTQMGATATAMLATCAVGGNAAASTITTGTWTLTGITSVPAFVSSTAYQSAIQTLLTQMIANATSTTVSLKAITYRRLQSAGRHLAAPAPAVQVTYSITAPAAQLMTIYVVCASSHTTGIVSQGLAVVLKAAGLSDTVSVAAFSTPATTSAPKAKASGTPGFSASVSLMTLGALLAMSFGI